MRPAGVRGGGPTGSMTAQNIYDDPRFFDGYARLPRSRKGLPAVFEWPAFQRLLPASLNGLRVLDLGCGLGYFAREAIARGARSVLGVDLSQRMLDQARALTADANIRYVRAGLEDFVPEAAAFDLVVSSLALHYIADYPHLVHRVAASLIPAAASPSRSSIRSSPRRAAAPGSPVPMARSCTGRSIAIARRARGARIGSSTAW